MENYNLLVAIIIVLFLVGMTIKGFLAIVIKYIFGFWDGLPMRFKISIGVVEIPCIVITTIIGLSFKHLFTNFKEVFIYLIIPNIAAFIINSILPSFKN